MTKRTLTDAERIALIRAAIQAANGDWHDATALWSIQNDIDWLLARAEAALPESTDEGLREAGDGYEIQTWVLHEPSGLVVLKGHPQLGGRYCMTDGGDWPCASVRAALAATLPATGGEGS